MATKMADDFYCAKPEGEEKCVWRENKGGLTLIETSEEVLKEKIENFKAEVLKLYNELGWTEPLSPDYTPFLYGYNVKEMIETFKGLQKHFEKFPEQKTKKNVKNIEKNLFLIHSIGVFQDLHFDNGVVTNHETPIFTWCVEKFKQYFANLFE